MEMKSAQENRSDDPINEDEPAVQVTSPGSPDESDMFGVRKKLPRVGDQYQAQIPDLIPDCDHLQPTNKSDNPQFVVGNNYFSIGLPVPIMWICSTVDTETKSPELLGDPNVATREKGPLHSKNSQADKTNMHNGLAMLKGKRIGVSSGCKIIRGGVPNEVDLHLPQDEKSILDQWRVEGCYPAPGTLCASWSKIEQESFLLGLYIFGKDLELVKGFIETKEMGNILSFYYGKFYRSSAYRRWSDNRKKKRRKKCIYGKKLFTGWRQQELLSRLLPRVSEECQNTLLEVSRAFEDGEISLEFYVSSLKSNVGMELLIESVGIGKGKQDLTAKVAERKKANQFKEQSGKSCSSLTSVDIIKLLKGDSRLSKTQSKNLFWEAVWPRLLANGWHSEQPKNHIYGGPKKPLVFLTPGIKKFSRRGLVKGEQYFDSFTEILDKIASEPKLIEIEVEAEKNSSSSEEHPCSTRIKLDQNSHSDHQPCHFLRPLNTNSGPKKLTVGDTGMAEGEEPLAIQKRRTLPAKIDNTSRQTKKSPKTSSSTTVSLKNDGCSSRKSVKKVGSSDILFNDQEGAKIFSSTSDICDVVVSSDSLCGTVTSSKQEFPIKCLDSSRASMGKPSNLKGMYPNKTMKYQFSRRAKVSRSNCLDPATKIQSVIACSREEVSKSTNRFDTGTGLKEDKLHLQLSLPGMSDILSGICPSHEKPASSSSVEDQSDDRNDSFLGEKSFLSKASHEKIQRRVLLDLNLPAPLDYDNGEPFITEMAYVQNDPNRNWTASHSEAPPPIEGSQSLRISAGDQKPDVISQRLSTRKRPLTTKALEALESNLLTAPKRRRHLEATSPDNLTTEPDLLTAPKKHRHLVASSADNLRAKPPQTVRNKVGNATNFIDVNPMISQSSVSGGLEEGCSRGTNLIYNSQLWGFL